MPHTFDSVAFIDASLGLHKAPYSSQVICLSGGWLAVRKSKQKDRVLFFLI